MVDIFNRVIAPWPPGDEIVLADGRSGVVVSCPPDDLTRPLVRIAFDVDGSTIVPEEVDLREREDLMPLSALPVAA